MKKRLLALLAVAGFCMTVGILVWRLNAPSPVYQGKTVKAWLLQLAGTDPKARDEAEAAFIKALGTNAVPELARLVRTDDARWRTLIWSHAMMLPKRVRWLVLSRVSGPVAQVTHPAAAQLLGRLGPAAAPAVPALIRMLRKGNPAEQMVAARSLAKIGAPALAPLVNVAVHEENGASRCAAGALFHYYPWPGSGRPAGETLLGDPMAPARQQAIETLGASAKANDIVIQVLARAARDPAPGVRLAALKALAQGNRNLQHVLPQLVACSYDESPAIREWSARVLGKIAPPARFAISELTYLAEDKDESVRAAARAALETIQASGLTNRPASPR